MPKHIISGLKYLAVIELKKKNLNSLEIANSLNMDRSTVSHYLHGRNISEKSIEVAEKIFELSSKDSFIMIDCLFDNKGLMNTIIDVCSPYAYKIKIKDSCIGCGICVENCYVGAVVLDNLNAKVKKEFCCGCFKCVEACPTNSIKIMEVEK